MNAIEERLREALADRAAHSPVDPDAWDKTVARSRRRFRPWLRLLGWLPAGFVIPAAAAAAIIAVVLAAISLTRGTHRASSASGTPAATATVSPPPGIPAEVINVLRAYPAVTAIVSIGLGDTRVYAWFTDLMNDDGCFVVLGTPSSSGGFTCGRWPAGPSGTDGSATNYGRVAPQITSVTARLNDGSPAPAVIVSGRGFPFNVWFATIPEGYNAVLTFRDAAGHVVTHLTDDLPAHGGVAIPDSGGIMVDGWTAYLTGGTVLWHGPDYGAIVPVGLPVKQHPLAVIYQETTHVNYALGYTPADVTLLALRTPSGVIYSGPTVAGWPGSGVRLWVHAGLPYGGLDPNTVVISYDAAGHPIAQQKLQSLLGS